MLRGESYVIHTFLQISSFLYFHNYIIGYYHFELKELNDLKILIFKLTFMKLLVNAIRTQNYIMFIITVQALIHSRHANFLTFWSRLTLKKWFKILIIENIKD